ncbi:hypothetical protein IWX90DRAFT_418221 [Phyllosticta citrichinensis]|uniref:Uncharacterized protein n=1 Tax=Phyllosticta citrichinensis TaxID=1130410 RepID=A0ABR1XI29_9PEZI
MARLPLLPLLFYALLALATCDISSATSTTSSTLSEPRLLADAEDIEDLRGELSALQATLELLLLVASSPVAAPLRVDDAATGSATVSTRTMEDVVVSQEADSSLEPTTAGSSLCHDRRAVWPVRDERTDFEAVILPGLPCPDVPASLDDCLGRHLPLKCRRSRKLPSPLHCASFLDYLVPEGIRDGHHRRCSPRPHNHKE